VHAVILLLVRKRSLNGEGIVVSEKSVATEFGAVDRAARPDALVRYLDTVTGVEAVQGYKLRSYDLLRIKPGHRVLDVGCGTGDDVRVIAKIVGELGRAVGIDNSEVMIAEAKKRSLGLNLPVEFRTATASDLPFQNGSYDATRSERLFQHLTDPSRALSEMIRVTRQGGRVSVLDPDWDTVTIDSPDRRLTRQILSASIDTHVNPWAGRQIYSLFHTAGLREIEILAATVPLLSFSVAEPVLELRKCIVKAVEKSAITKDEGSEWLQELEERDRTGRFFSSITGFGVVGTKP
jgi:ubiquinone/menaquinone biosynthesis C-methylase UbiE